MKQSRTHRTFFQDRRINTEIHPIKNYVFTLVNNCLLFQFNKPKYFPLNKGRSNNKSDVFQRPVSESVIDQKAYKCLCWLC